MPPSALILKQFGSIDESIQLQPQPAPPLRPGQIRVQMKAAPVNPADLNLIQGKYPIPVEFPCVIGNEGAGIVIETAADVIGIETGMTVISKAALGTWCEERVLNPEDVVLVPEAIPIETAAMLSVNPTTAWRLLHDFIDLQAGDWVIQNAANSVVGRAVIHFARHLGIHTINIVRREDLIEPLKAAGADEVILDEDRFSRVVKDMTKDSPIRLGLNAVGGKSATEIAKSLAEGGCMVTYGAMGMQPLEIPNGLLIFKNISLRGFWLTKWYQQAEPLDVQSMFGRIFQILLQDEFTLPVAQRYTLADYPTALTHAQESNRNGKILFTMNEG